MKATFAGASDACVDNSTTTTGAQSPVAQARAVIEGEKIKGWVHSVMLALCVAGLVAVMALYLQSQRQLYDAYTDAKTQVWVRQDKDESRFLEFVSGPYAHLAGKVEALQIEFSKCKESRQ